MFETKYFQIDKLLKKSAEKRKGSDSVSFGISDFIDPVNLARKLRSPSADDLLLQYLRSRLKPVTLELLDEYVKNKSASEEFLNALVEDFNALLKDKDLYNEEPFRDLRLSAETSRLKQEQQTAKEQQTDVDPARLNRMLLEEAYPQDVSNSLFQINKIQMANEAGYEYVKDRGNKYFYIQCLLHGAAKRLDKVGKRPGKDKADDRPGKKGDFEDSLQDFLVKDLQLLFGMYCFIDPRGDEENAAPYYLLGDFNKGALTPSFTFPFFVNTKNIRNNREFHKLPEEWLSFYFHLNSVTRKQILFKDDFVKFFGNEEWRRNKGLEKKYNFFYASSGEIDHTILQWLFCSLVPDTDFNSSFAIPITNLFGDEGMQKKCLDEKHSDVLAKIIKEEDGKQRLLVRDGDSETTTCNIREWLQCFGLLNDTKSMVPTERLLAAIEFFYFHVKHWKDRKIGFNTDTYFSKGKTRRKFYGDCLKGKRKNLKCEKAVNIFTDLCEEFLPVLSKDYLRLREQIKDADTLYEKLDSVVSSYLDVLEIFARENQQKRRVFSDYGRFNILSHFFQRNVLPLYNPFLKDQTCRGFIIIPIFSNPHESGESAKDKNMRDLGYFLGLIKDSDSKGRCYFNWRTHSDNATESETIDFFYNEYLFHLQNFVYNLGSKEVKQIYYKGIEEEHKKEIRRQATHAAIADIINRNQAHHIGSHVSNRATLDKVLERLGKKYSDLCDKTLYLSILDLLNRLNQYRDERSEYLTYLAQYSSPSSAYLFKDVLQPFIENTLLMDNIAANENINYVKEKNGKLLRNRLRLQVRLNDGGTVKSFKASYKTQDNSELYSSENLPYLRKKTDEGFEYETVKLSQPDLEVSLPGTLGKHALYSFLENFIRNSAKHGGDEKYKGLIIFIELFDLDNPDYLTVRVTDNCSRIKDQKKIDGFNESIAKPILEKENLGLIDMKVNACLLEGKELTDKNCSESLHVGRTNEILYYEFKIARPKKVVFIGCNEKIRQEKIDGYFYFETVDAYIDASISKSFKFAVIDKELLEGLDQKKKDELFRQLPSRVLNFQNIEEDLSNSKGADLLPILYKHWLAHLSNPDESDHKEPDYQVHLTFQQSSDVPQTRQFKECKAFSDHPILKFYSAEDLSGNVSFADSKQHIFFDRHGAIISERFKKSFVWDEKKHCWILIDKNNPDFDYIFRYNLTSNAELLPYELAEAGMLRVLVIDERAAEQSSRIIQDSQDDDDRRKLEAYQYGFSKFNLSREKNKLTLFDTAWAANVFIATHLNNVPLKDEITLDDDDKHFLKVDVTKEEIKYWVNITSLYGDYNVSSNEWEFSGEAPRRNPIDLKPHVLVIHRTKLKELIDNQAALDRIATEIPYVIVTTGSGTTHGIGGNFKILPFSTVNELVFGKRIQKLRLSKILLELTKNKI